MEPISQFAEASYVNQEVPSKNPQAQVAPNAYNGYSQSDQDFTSIGTKENLETHLQRCKKAYFDHCLEEAHRLMDICEQIKSHANGEALVEIESILDKEKEFFETIKNEYNYMHKVLNELNTNEGWIVDSVGSSATLYYKYIPNTELVTLKLEADVDVPIQNMLTLVNEINLWNHWVPFMKRTSELKRLHRSAAVYYAELGLPYPLHNREVHLYGFAVNRLYENQSILILAESIDDNKEFIEKHKVKKVDKTGTVNMDIEFAGFEIIPLERNKCRLRGVANINPKFKWLPVSVLNFVLKKGIHFVMDRLIRRAKNFKGSVWEKEITREEKREFYDWLNKVIEEYYSSQNK